MKWREKPRLVKSKVRHLKNKMMKAFAEGKAAGRLEYSESRVSKWRDLVKFHQWLKDERVIPLQPQSLKVVKSFCETYTTSTVGNGSNSDSE